MTKNNNNEQKSLYYKLAEIKDGYGLPILGIEATSEVVHYSNGHIKQLEEFINMIHNGLIFHKYIKDVVTQLCNKRCKDSKDVKRAGLNLNSLDLAYCLPDYQYGIKSGTINTEYIPENIEIPLEEIGFWRNQLLEENQKLNEDYNNSGVWKYCSIIKPPVFENVDNQRVKEYYRDKKLQEYFLSNLTQDQLYDFYKEHVDELTETIAEKSEGLAQLKVIQEEISKVLQANKELTKQVEELKGQQYLGQVTPYSLFKGITKKQKGTFSEITNKSDEKILLKNLMMNDSSLSVDEKKLEFENLKQESLTYEIDKWLGKNLTKQERRLLRTLRYIIYQMIEQNKVSGSGKSIYEAEILLSEIYEKYGLTKRKDGSYNHDQTKEIQSILFGITTRGLHEDILFKHNTILKTRLLLQVQIIKKQKVVINKEENPQGQEQLLGVRVVVPRFLFVSDNEELTSYYYQDIEGFKRLMTIPGMAKSDVAFNIAEYLEWYLSSRQEEKKLDLESLIKEGGEILQKRYIKDRGKAMQMMKTILDNMVQAKYLIKEWKLVKGKYDQDQFVFVNLRHKLLTSNLSVKKITYTRNKATKKLNTRYKK